MIATLRLHRIFMSVPKKQFNVTYLFMEAIYSSGRNFKQSWEWVFSVSVHLTVVTLIRFNTLSHFITCLCCQMTFENHRHSKFRFRRTYFYMSLPQASQSHVTQIFSTPPQPTLTNSKVFQLQNYWPMFLSAILLIFIFAIQVGYLIIKLKFCH